MKARLQFVRGEWQGREPAAADGQQKAGAVDKASAIKTNGEAEWTLK